MSLKAKIEAVVYAAEEPVTLVQLAGLFAQEALEWKQAKEAEAAAAAAEAEAGVVEEPILAVEEAPDAAVQSGDASLAPPEPIAPMVVPPAEGEAVEELSKGEDEENATAEVETQETPEEVSAEMPAAEETAVTSEVTESAETVSPEAEKPSEPETAPVVDPAQAEEEEKRAARQRERDVREILRGLLDELIAEYETADRGIEMREIAGGYRFATKPEYHDAVRAFVKSLKPPMKLSLPALETLAVIAYKQPITAPEVSEIRGVDSAGVLGSLISRKLVTTAGRKQVVGRPILYKTTKEFLLRFGLKDLNELPSMEEFEKMATGALAEVDEAMPESAPEGAAQAASEQEEATEQTAEATESADGRAEAQVEASQAQEPDAAAEAAPASEAETEEESQPKEEAPAEVEDAAEEIAVEITAEESAVAVTEEDSVPVEPAIEEDPDVSGSSVPTPEEAEAAEELAEAEAEKSAETEEPETSHPSEEESAEEEFPDEEAEEVSDREQRS